LNHVIPLGERPNSFWQEVIEWSRDNGIAVLFVRRCMRMSRRAFSTATRDLTVLRFGGMTLGKIVAASVIIRQRDVALFHIRFGIANSKG
jgi:hypothetical protein